MFAKVVAKKFTGWTSTTNGAPPKMVEYAKTLAKHGTEGIKSKGKLNGYERILADERINHLMAPKYTLNKSNIHQAVTELSSDKHLQYSYLNTLVDKVKKKDDIRTIIKYVRSVAAGNLTADQRAHLVMACVEKLKYVDVIREFLP